MISSALIRSWPIGFSTTTRVKFGEFGGAISPASDRHLTESVIASGGIGERAHVAEAFRAGADAVLAASVFHDGDDTVDGIKADLSLRGIRVRR